VPLGITSKLFWSSAELKSFQVVIIGLLYVQDERYLAGAWMHWSEGTIVKVRMTIRPGGYDDASQGWTGGYATQSMTTGSVYLNCEFVVLDGPYAKNRALRDYIKIVLVFSRVKIIPSRHYWTPLCSG
jgi:hypothetical protein